LACNILYDYLFFCVILHWQLRAWMLCIGFTLGYGSMFSKIWTLYRLTTRSRRDKQVVVYTWVISLHFVHGCGTICRPILQFRDGL